MVCLMCIKRNPPMLKMFNKIVAVKLFTDYSGKYNACVRNDLSCSIKAVQEAMRLFNGVSSFLSK